MPVTKKRPSFPWLANTSIHQLPTPASFSIVVPSQFNVISLFLFSPLVAEYVRELRSAYDVPAAFAEGTNSMTKLQPP